jgi:hypothetical protein
MRLFVKVVFGFEYTMFVGDSMHNATSASQSFYTHGVNMDCCFQIWCTQSGNNIHTFKSSVKFYWHKGTTQQCKLQVHMSTIVKKWKREITLPMLW